MWGLEVVGLLFEWGGLVVEGVEGFVGVGGVFFDGVGEGE